MNRVTKKTFDIETYLKEINNTEEQVSKAKEVKEEEEEEEEEEEWNTNLWL